MPSPDEQATAREITAVLTAAATVVVQHDGEDGMG